MQLPNSLTACFQTQGWTLHPHQLAMLDLAQNPSTLLIAPTGGGKTLAGFLPSLCELALGYKGLHTLYISPLKALTADIRRNLRRPVGGANLPIRIEDRTGDTTCTQRRRQRADPPHILLTTDTPPPWSGGGGKYAIPAILEQVKRHNITLIFHNTRA